MDLTKVREILLKRTSINSETGCWEYLDVNSDGYGYVRIDHIPCVVHRLSAMIFLDYSPFSDLIVCHKLECKSKNCWNPENIYIGTYADNNQDTVKAGNHFSPQRDKTHCKNDHEFTPENTLIYRRPSGRIERICLTCKRERAREYKRQHTINFSMNKKVG